MIMVRADANEIMGLGHVMRCLSIAHAFADRKETVIFLTADHKADSLINDKGFKTICLETDWKNMNEEPIGEILKKCQPDLAIIDSYCVTDQYVSEISRYTNSLYIDDLNVSIWDVDFLVNYNVFSNSMDYTGYRYGRTKVFIGPNYVPLREEFMGVPMHTIKPVTDILISAGGADPGRITEKLIKLCNKFEDFCFHFVIGELNQRKEEIKRNLPSNAILHINEQNMSKLMQKCDIAISAAGSTLYELCACGTPTITYTLADNQLCAAEEFDKQNLMINAGDCRDNDRFVNDIYSIMGDLIENMDRRRFMSVNMQTLVDGYGAERLATQISECVGI